jgi:hypothetical protein
MKTKHPEPLWLAYLFILGLLAALIWLV